MEGGLVASAWRFVSTLRSEVENLALMATELLGRSKLRAMLRSQLVEKTGAEDDWLVAKFDMLLFGEIADPSEGVAPPLWACRLAVELLLL